MFLLHYCVLIWDLSFSFIFVLCWVFNVLQVYYCTMIFVFHMLCSCFTLFIMFICFCFPYSFPPIAPTLFCLLMFLFLNFALGSNNFTFLFLHLHLCSCAFTLFQVWATLCFMFLQTYSTPFLSCNSFTTKCSNSFNFIVPFLCMVVLSFIGIH